MDVHGNDTAHIELQHPFVLVIFRWVLAGIGVVANAFVIFVFIYNKTYKKSLSLKLLLHQTGIDLIGSLMFLIFHNMDVPDGVGGTVFCKMAFLFLYMTAASTFNFVMVTIERYIAVVHPILYRQKSLGGKMKYLSLIIPHVCGIMLTVSIPIEAEKNPNVSECTFTEINPLAGTLLIIIDWLVPISMMLYYYVRMLLKLHKTRKVGQQPSSESQPKNGGRDYRVKSDLLATLILIAFVYFLTYTPNSVFMLIYFLYHGVSYKYYIFLELSLLFLELNLILNPFIYCIACKDFQRGLRKIRCNIIHRLEKHTRSPTVVV